MDHPMILVYNACKRTVSREGLCLTVESHWYGTCVLNKKILTQMPLFLTIKFFSNARLSLDARESPPKYATVDRYLAHESIL